MNANQKKELQHISKLTGRSVEELIATAVEAFLNSNEVFQIEDQEFDKAIAALPL